ncbi:MAG: DUF2179 domain-containing protein [Clostridia bacterium]|nr:DUF2179 domain-containing protein [Clostridia bacterium]
MQIFLLCLKIFFCRIIDVSMATFRTVITVKGKNTIAALIAVVESLIWFLVIREALSFETANFSETLIIAIAYSLGFAAGTFIGGALSKKITGNIEVQVVTSSKDNSIITKLQEAGFAITVTSSEATQFSGEKYLLFSVMKSTKLDEFKKLVYELDKNAFIMVAETKYMYNGFIK